MISTAIVVIAYAFFVLVGGILGFLKAKSLPSLIAGTLGGLVLLASANGIRYGWAWGLPLALTLMAGLLVFFSIRYLRSSPRAFMPGGLMAILSLLALAGVWLTAHGH